MKDTTIQAGAQEQQRSTSKDETKTGAVTSLSALGMRLKTPDEILDSELSQCPKLAAENRTANNAAADKQQQQKHQVKDAEPYH